MSTDLGRRASNVTFAEAEVRRLARLAAKYPNGDPRAAKHVENLRAAKERLAETRAELEAARAHAS